MDPNRQQRDVPQNAIPAGCFGQGNVPTLERGIISGDNVQFGRLRRRSHLSQSESSGAEEERLSSSVEASGSYGQSPVLRGMQAEAVWVNRSSYEQAEGHYLRGLASNGIGPQSSSPRSPSTRGLTFHSRRIQDQGRSRTITESRVSDNASSLLQSDYSCGTTQSDNHGVIKQNIWFDKQCYDDAERRFYEGTSGPAPQQQQQSSSHSGDQELVSRMKSLELENQTLHKVVEDMRAALQKLETRVGVLEKSPAPAAVPCAKAAPVQSAPAKQVKVENDDDDIDLFGSDEEDEEAERLKQERLEAYAAKKAKKPAVIAKSSILLDVKPWDDETDMAKLEECVRSVQMDGLLWGASKLVPVGYGIKKLQINCVVEDDKVGTDILEEEITKFEDFVQSVDVAAFNKI
uniref:Elongation factor-1, delta, a n=1 Tax=Nothobranchius kadleci TaxID=1051664 RepID=A0A1A8BGS6_NOTKA